MWIFNLILWLFWMCSPVYYDQLVSSGQTCWYYAPRHGEAPATPEPPCTYGPDAH